VIHLAILFKVDAGFLSLLVVLDLLAGELSAKEYGAFMSVAPLAQNFALFFTHNCSPARARWTRRSESLVVRAMTAMESQLESMPTFLSMQSSFPAQAGTGDIPDRNPSGSAPR
jgi:hypothetical protein